MPDFKRNKSVPLGHGVTLRSVGVQGRATNARPVRTTDGPVRDAAPGAPGAALAAGGVPAGAADELGSAITGAGMVLQTTVGLTRLVAPAARPGAATRGGAQTPRVELDVDAPPPGEDQVALEVDDSGYLRWHLPQVTGSGTAATTRAGGKQRFVVPVDQFPLAAAPGDSSTRFGVGFGIGKVLHILRFDVAVGFLATQAVGLWERRFRPYGLHMAHRDGTMGADATADLLVQLDRGPFLMLVHGFLGRCPSTFGGLLADTALFSALHDRYDGRVLLFDHPTMHLSPQDNATFLLGRLPTDRTLDVDVLAHSRGGLVTRQLAHQPGGPPPRIANLVHIAAPNAGTTLASNDKLGDLLDVFTNLVSLFPDPGSSVVLEAVMELVKQVAQGAFGGLPGIAAMDPANAELAALNTHPPTGSVRAITTDYEPASSESLGAKALDVLVDALFGTANDLVVPTDGVFDAGSYVIADPFRAISAAGEVPLTHTTFFRNAAVRAQIGGWLL